MTCMKQEFCIHEKYCQRHIGQNFDSCILFSRNSKPMTNEEYIHSLNTEQLAEELLAWWFDGANTYSQFGLFQWEIDKAKDKITKWLKEIHKE